MEYEIVWSISASREMRRLDRSVAKRIYSKVDQLKEKPEILLERLVNPPCYRLRVGDYRIILDIQNEVLRILTLKAGHRSAVYDK
ncbi:MAG: type II toxin-antitoxin system RelE family toxin [Thermoplasmata archaeon]